ncbi:Aste57867_21474 [Aphanomyces stellatus]|uniref:Aste57867_21474 protein n=1 Tax=Aphanomyces stellatus TaxID=120398 RepID=A0A485LMF8_9STRA|nr:hypothetical protein As57867_021405 [Aphanomyces stellatus]VFT98144.1 Aste57867_21474 [Aphanomyces stellatus]
MDGADMVGMLADMVGHSLHEDEIQLVLAKNEGDMTKALDELLSLMAIREMPDAMAPRENTQGDGSLQWELFTNELTAYGLDDEACHELVQVLKERKGTEKLTTSTIMLELLDAMDDVDEHPLQDLQNRYPMIPFDMIQEAYELHNYDVKATAASLIETKELLNESGTIETFSYASVVKPKQTMTAAPPPSVQDKYEFPTLTRFQLGQPATTTSVWAKETQGLPRGRGTLTTRMKFEQLRHSFPSVDPDVVCAALLVSDSSVVAAEAILESTFPNACVKPKQSTGRRVDEDDASSSSMFTDEHAAVEWENRGFAYYQAETDALQDEISSLHADALRKFAGKYNHFLGRERLDRLHALRRKLKSVRDQAAYAFFLEHQSHVATGRPIDLHGLYIQEACQVLDWCLKYCRDHRVNKFTVITGVGNHTVRGGRMYSTFPIALARRGIPFAQEGGHLVIYPHQNVAARRYIWHAVTPLASRQRGGHVAFGILTNVVTMATETEGAAAMSEERGRRKKFSLKRWLKKVLGKHRRSAEEKQVRRKQRKDLKKAKHDDPTDALADRLDRLPPWTDLKRDNQAPDVGMMDDEDNQDEPERASAAFHVGVPYTGAITIDNPLLEDHPPAHEALTKSVAFRKMDPLTPETPSSDAPVVYGRSREDLCSQIKMLPQNPVDFLHEIKMRQRSRAHYSQGPRAPIKRKEPQFTGPIALVLARSAAMLPDSDDESDESSDGEWE